MAKGPEAQLQTAAIDLAKYAGWLAHHGRPARTAKGWTTPLEGHKGFPDVVFVSQKFDLVLFVEFKSERGKVSPEQAEWAAALENICRATNGRMAYRLWRPSDWDQIETTMRTGKLPTTETEKQ